MEEKSTYAVEMVSIVTEATGNLKPVWEFKCQCGKTLTYYPKQDLVCSNCYWAWTVEIIARGISND